ncbi:MAG: hypothetical protein U0840_31410 [Gemmataceae bacterium]
MTTSVPREVLARVKKLALLPGEVMQSRWAVSVTRLTSLKSLCQDHGVANRFVTHLARKTLERVRQGQGRSSHPNTDEQRVHQGLMADALAEMDAWMYDQADERRRNLWDLLGKMRQQQNDYQNIKWGAVRLINEWELLLFEYVLKCLINPAREAPYWAYQTARHYGERYNSSEGTGLISSSVPLGQDIVDSWLQEYGLDPVALTAPASEKKAKKEPHPATGRKKSHGVGKKKAKFTHRQGQFLAFIHHYHKLHRQGPAEHDLVSFFRVTPPAAHGMIVKLEELGLITREPGVARSARVVIPEAEIPPLEDVEGPAW